MLFGEFMAALRQGHIYQVYLLAGEEPYFIERAERRILGAICGDDADRASMVHIFDGDLPVPELMEQLTTMPLFAEKSVVLLRGTKLFHDTKGKDAVAKGRPDQDMERLMALLEAMPPANHVIFETDKADKRRKIYKVVQKVGAVLDADPVNPWNIDGWLKEKLLELGREFDREAKAYFMEAVSMMRPISLVALDQEFTKLTLYTDEKRFTRQDLVQVFSRLPEVSGFSLLEAIDGQEPKRALMLLERQLAEGTFLPLLLAGLVRHVRQLWQARDYMAKGLSAKELAVALGLKPFIAAKVSRAAATYHKALLRRVFLRLAEADYLLKTGQAGAEVLEEAVIALLRRER